MHRDEKSSAAPWFSPGLVNDDECVIRTIWDPQHVKDGKLANAAISLDDIRYNGWSVDRKAFTSHWRLQLHHWWWQIRRRIRGKLAIANFFVLQIPVAMLRKRDDDGQQRLVVTDQALCTNPAHAQALSAQKISENAARKIRTKLLRELPQYTALRAAFSPNDRHGWERGMIRKYGACYRQIRQRLLAFS